MRIWKGFAWPGQDTIVCTPAATPRRSCSEGHPGHSPCAIQTTFLKESSDFSWSTRSRSMLTSLFNSTVCAPSSRSSTTDVDVTTSSASPRLEVAEDEPHCAHPAKTKPSTSQKGPGTHHCHQPHQILPDMDTPPGGGRPLV